MELIIQSKTQGAELTSICYQGKEKLFQGEKVLDKEGNPFWGRQAPILFPMVGKLKEGKTILDGKVYKMSQHGFARDMEFKEIKKTNQEHQYMLKSNEETLKKYPYCFELWVTYTVYENKLMVKYEVKNQEEREIYFGLGGHPAFLCDYSKGDYELLFEKEEKNIEFLKLEDGLISEETVKNILQENKLILKEDSFKDDAIIMKNIASQYVILQNGKTKQRLLKFTFGGFPYLALWSKKQAPFVCIEPWQNTADKVNSKGKFLEKDAIICLKPKRIFSCSYQIEFF